LGESVGKGETTLVPVSLLRQILVLDRLWTLVAKIF
jgi:hypothetical protein